MDLKQNISSELKRAIKAGDKLKISTLRLLLNAIKNKEIDKRAELTEEEIHQAVQTLLRQRAESIEHFEKAGRKDLVEKEAKEAEILKSFLPPQLTEDEVRSMVKETAEEVGAAGMKDMGRLMKAVMPKVKGRAEGSTVSSIVKEVLGG